MADPLIDQIRDELGQRWPRDAALARLLAAITDRMQVLHTERSSATRALLSLTQDLECTQQKFHDLGASYVRQTMQHVSEAVLLVDGLGVVKDVNPTAELLLDCVGASLRGRMACRLFAHPKIAASSGADEDLWRQLVATEEPQRVALRREDTTKAPKVVAVSLAPVEVDGADHFLLRIKPDMDEGGASCPAARLRRAETTLAAIADAVIACTKHGKIEYANVAAEQLLGDAGDSLLGRSLGTALRLADLRGNALEPVDADGLYDHPDWQRPRRLLLRRDAATGLPVEITAANLAAPGSAEAGLLLVIRDLSKEKGLRDQLSHQAAHDALTGLVNRSRLEAELQQALGEVREQGAAECALLYLDVDQFRLINDTCGHAAGDALLVQLTARLRARLRKGDTLARLGGDEFAVLVRGCSPARSLEVAEDLRRSAAAMHFAHLGRAYPHTVSVGVAQITASSDSVANVLSHADVACFAAKDAGRNQVHLYQPERVPERQLEMQWVARLTRAHDEDRLHLYQQPIVPVEARNFGPAHYELLLRMRDRFGQIIEPNLFIPAAERYNIMPRIDRWVVRRVLRDLVERRDEYASDANYTLAINLSGTSLSDEDFLDFVRRELQAHPVAPGGVCFEITETAVVANIGNVAHFMHELKQLGCRFALDDFGSGLSSFAYLKELPVDYLKIDGHFIRHLRDDAVNRTMVDAIHRVGHAMGIRTIAERVESAEVLRELTKIGIDLAQGYYISRPRPVVNRSSFRTARLMQQAGVIA